MSQSNFYDISQSSRWAVNTPQPASFNLPFLAEEAGHYFAGSHFYVQLRKSTSFQVVFTLAGSGLVELGGTQLLLEPGTAMLLPLAQAPVLQTGSDAFWEFKWVRFYAADITPYLSILYGDEEPSPIVPEAPEAFDALLEDVLCACTFKEILSFLRTNSTIIRILTALCTGRIVKLSKKYSQHQSDISEAILYIHANYQNNITLDDLMDIVSISKYYFVKLFKRYTGLSPYDYILHHRINESKKLLESTNQSISSIAAAVGFPYESNFIKQFRRITKTTPLHYRRQ